VHERGRSASSLEAMSSSRVGSICGLLSSIFFVTSLVVVVDPYPPGSIHFLWGLCGVFFVASIGVWFQVPWARIVFFIAGILFLGVSSGPILGYACAGNPVGCFRHGLLSEPTLAVAYYLAEIICSDYSLRCYEIAACVPPGVTAAAMTILLIPSASNKRWSGRDT
jgi:hypothetical protein